MITVSFERLAAECEYEFAKGPNSESDGFRSSIIKVKLAL